MSAMLGLLAIRLTDELLGPRWEGAAPVVLLNRWVALGNLTDLLRVVLQAGALSLGALPVPTPPAEGGLTVISTDA